MPIFQTNIYLLKINSITHNFVFIFVSVALFSLSKIICTVTTHTEQRNTYACVSSTVTVYIHLVFYDFYGYVLIKMTSPMGPFYLAFVGVNF